VPTILDLARRRSHDLEANFAAMAASK